MELEVRVVGGIESCYVSLPLLLVQTLHYTSSYPLPQVLALELRSRNDDVWFVAWSGAAAPSSAIEVAQQFADCINLPDHINVQVRGVTNLPKATLVTIEPSSEDDWEVLELNSEYAEAAILKQVRVVQEAMKFPLWLHGHTIITFVVVSTFPKEVVVQLVPGTEVAVAPKRRKKELSKVSYAQSKTKEHPVPRPMLRVQDQDGRMIQKTIVQSVELEVMLTSAVFVNPETAKSYGLESLRLVTIEPRLPSEENTKNGGPDALIKRCDSNPRENNGGISHNKKRSHRAIVRLLLSESVAKGHVMIARHLRLYLKADLHSWVYLKSCNIDLKKEIPSLLLSPCQFYATAKKRALESNNKEAFNGQHDNEMDNSLLKTDFNTNKDLLNCSIHEKVIAALSSEYPNKDEGAVSHYETPKGLRNLLQAWFFVQHDAIVSNSGVETSSLVLANETLVCIEVKGNKVEAPGNMHGPSKGSKDGKKPIQIPPVDLIYILTISEKPLHKGEVVCYEVPISNGNNRYSNLDDLELLFRKLKLSGPLSAYGVKERTSNKIFYSTLSSLSWMRTSAAEVINRLVILLSPACGMWLSKYSLPHPGNILIYGPHGSGKTTLAKAIAKSLEEDKDILAHIVYVSCSELALEKSQVVRQSLSDCISEALDHSPSLVIFDDLDSIIPSGSDSEESVPSTSAVALREFLTDVMDEYEETRESSCQVGPIVFIACVQSLESLPQTLSSSGRFDFHVQLPAPAASERAAILKHEIQKRSLHCSSDILLDVASKCDGYDAYDLETLIDRTIHAAVGRFLPNHNALEEHGEHTLVRADFSQAMCDFLPVAMRDITKSAPEGGPRGWHDVGGLTNIRDAIKEMVELPSRFPDIFGQAPLRLRSNVLLYGPPGCGKTHIVGAAAAACSLRFISVKGPELLNKYIGASEQAVRDIFSKAIAAAPCLLFFDEFDSIAPKRGHDNTGVTDRVVNQFLTELDGVEALTGVFVFAATSRPDLLDAALLRPGRLDRLLFCDFPSQNERFDILTVLSEKLPVAKDVDLHEIASMTEGFSGADLQALLSDAQLEAVHELLISAGSDKPGKKPVITHVHLKSIASRARPSVSEAEKRRLGYIYSQLLDSKISVAEQSRDAKGKRATLA